MVNLACVLRPSDKDIAIGKGVDKGAGFLVAIVKLAGFDKFEKFEAFVQP